MSRGGLSPQTLLLGDRRLVAVWAADVAERTVPVFEAEAPGDGRMAALLERTRRFASGELGAGECIRRRFEGGARPGEVGPAAMAAISAAGQAAAVCHMGAHGLGAAAYALRAVDLADGSVEDELRWQVAHASPDVRVALRSLPALGENASGPLGAGMLASGDLGSHLRALQQRLLAAAD